MRPEPSKNQKDQQLQLIREKYNIDDAGKCNLCLTDVEMIKIQKIQRRVRAWLVKRQNLDMESASEILTSAFISPKQCNVDEAAAAVIIQRTVRSWLMAHKD